jgi:hypothetical protein
MPRVWPSCMHGTAQLRERVVRAAESDTACTTVKDAPGRLSGVDTEGAEFAEVDAQ